MSVQVVRSILYATVCDLITASPAVYADTGVAYDKVRKRTLLRLDKTGNPNAFKDDLADVEDTPELAVLYGPWSIADFAEHQRYAYRAGNPAQGTVTELTQGFRLDITHTNQDATRNDPLIVAVIDAIKVGGPGLNLMPAVLPYVVRGRITAQTDYGYPSRPLNPGIDPTIRQKTTVSFDVVTRWKGEPSPTRNA